MGALDGIRVVDLSRVLAGPYCTQQLAEHGAEVIKIERPGTGDDTRYFGPPFVEGESAYFMSVNKGKKSVALDLKTDAGQRALTRLLAVSDVLVENFRTGTMEKMGCGYEHIQEQFPRLVYCSITGFGHTGPQASRPGYDVVLQGEGGLMSVTGFPEGEPTKVGVAIADIIAGMQASFAICAALYARERTGRGQKIDIAMLDTQVGILTFLAGSYFATGASPGRIGNRHPTIAPYEPFAAQDGYIILAVGNDALWQRFCEATGLTGLLADARFRTNALRVEHRDTLKALIEEHTGARTRAELAAALEPVGIPCGSIKTIGEVLTDPQVLAREMVVELPHATLGTVKATGVPVKLRGTPGKIEKGAPVLGEDTENVLKMLGLDLEG